MGKRRDYTNEEKLKILEKYDQLPKISQRDAAIQLGISQPLLCKFLKNRSDIETSARLNENLKRKRNRSGKDKQVEAALKLWFTSVREKNASVDGPLLREKAKQIAQTMGKDDFNATDGWFGRWKKRENIVYKNHTMTIEDICQEVAGESGAGGPESLEDGEDEEMPEDPPTSAQMQEAWNILRRGVQHRATNFEKLYDFENYIQTLINEYK